MNFSFYNLFIIFLCICISNSIGAVKSNYGPYPVDLPAGGRNAVHGWLILPLDQQLPNENDPGQPIQAWFSHHVPEFWTDSPHDWQIIMAGTLTPMSVAENQTLPIDLPYPPAAELLVNEFTFTPPPPFSLNDLLTGTITELKGVVYNGSFDTSYERIAIALATLDITQLTTAVYLNESTAISSYSSQRYLSYPRTQISSQNPTSGIFHFYFAHEIHAVPDFDQIVHVTIDLEACFCSSCSNSSVYDLISTPGAEWAIQDLPNDLDHRLKPDTTPVVVAQLLSEQNLSCKVQVLEQIHCMIGPGFDKNC